MTLKDRFNYWLYCNDYNAIVALVYIVIVVTFCFVLGMVCGCGFTMKGGGLPQW
jgi:hypothetical protein